MKFIASFQKTVQMTEDHWGVTTQSLLCDEKTTLGAIREWQRDNYHIQKDDAKFRMDEITLSEPDEAVK